jgi:uncharacterized membrane protein
MPYCCQCGAPAGSTDKFCAGCGARQPASPGAAASAGASGAGAATGPPKLPPADFLGGVSDKNASRLCYIPWLGWIAAIIVLASVRYKRDTAAAREVRFNAFQGLYLFVAWLIVDWVLTPAIRFGAIGMGDSFRPLEGLLRVAILAAWIVMLVKVSHSEHYRLPIVGEMAERSVEEQRA